MILPEDPDPYTERLRRELIEVRQERDRLKCQVAELKEGLDEANLAASRAGRMADRYAEDYKKRLRQDADMDRQLAAFYGMP